MSEFNKVESRVLARSANEAKKYAVVQKMLLSLLICIVIVLILTYIISVLYSRFGSFTVTVNKFDSAKFSLVLSEVNNFDDRILRLNAKAANDITCISKDWLPSDLDSINGEHNGQNHLAYTFYLKNIGSDTVTYEYYMYIANVTNNVDTAVRIRIYKDGKPITYARTRSDGNGAEEGTTEFLTKRSVVREQVEDFGPNDVTKFTVVIWIEGDDPECKDELIGGSLKSDMTITVIESKNAE